MRTPTTVQTEATRQPTPAQLQRRAALQRFNLIAVYLPVGLLVTVALVPLILLLWNSLTPAGEQARQFTSAVANLIIVLMLCPLMLLCATVPLGALAVVVRRRQTAASRQTGGEEPFERDGAGRFHRFLWRIDQTVDRLRWQTSKMVNRITRPVINFNARLAYLAAFFRNLFDRS